MITQVFRGRTLADARRAAENALGRDAVVITSRTVPRTGVMGLLGAVDFEIAAASAGKILASSSGPASTARVSASNPFSGDAHRGEGLKPRTTTGDDLAALRTELRSELRAVRTTIARAPAPVENDSAPAFAQLETELATLRTTLEAVLATSEPAGRADDVARALRARGIEGPAAKALAKAARAAAGDDADARLREAARELVPVSPCPTVGGRKGRTVVAMVGPSGVGKTTTIAKLAARAILDDNLRVTLVACDGHRVGAVDQLSRFASLLGADFASATTPAELERVIANANTDIVFIDTAGRGPEAKGSVEHAIGKAARARAGSGTYHVLLCLPATLRALDAAQVVRTFAPCGPTALAITKLDETAAPAGIAHGAVASHLPVAVLCFGQRVPEDIAPATSEDIVEYLLGSVATEADAQ
jgi:flagellar biosynthesis protein FlhF